MLITFKELGLTKAEAEIMLSRMKETIKEAHGEEKAEGIGSITDDGILTNYPQAFTINELTLTQLIKSSGINVKLKAMVHKCPNCGSRAKFYANEKLTKAFDKKEAVVMSIFNSETSKIDGLTLYCFNCNLGFSKIQDEPEDTQQEG